MLDVLIDLFLILIGLKKRKKEDKELISPNINTPNHEEDKDTEKELIKQEMSVCAGCNRTLENGAVYELKKAWCTECYKTHVLKV